MSPRKRPVGDGKFLLEYEEVSSTQNVARTLHKSGETAIIGIIAAYQLDGRGRSGSKWVAPRGTCLLVTYILPLEDASIAPKIGMAAAVAAAESIEELSGLTTGLKWPNDVLLNGRKVAGVLAETVSSAESRMAALVGIGVNLNVESFPAELEQTATSVRIEGRRSTPLEEFEAILRTKLFERCAEISSRGFASIRERWLNRDQTFGRRYRGVTEGGSIEGTAVSLAESGALVLTLEDGSSYETVSATSVP